MDYPSVECRIQLWIRSEPIPAGVATGQGSRKGSWSVTAAKTVGKREKSRLKTVEDFLPTHLRERLCGYKKEKVH